MDRISKRLTHQFPSFHHIFSYAFRQRHHPTSSIVRCRYSSSKPTNRLSRLQTLQSRLPKRFQHLIQPLISAPVSNITSFLILHEITAIVPLLGIFAALHYFSTLFPFFTSDSPDALISSQSLSVVTAPMTSAEDDILISPGVEDDTSPSLTISSIVGESESTSDGSRTAIHTNRNGREDVNTREQGRVRGGDSTPDRYSANLDNPVRGRPSTLEHITLEEDVNPSSTPEEPSRPGSVSLPQTHPQIEKLNITAQSRDPSDIQTEPRTTTNPAEQRVLQTLVSTLRHYLGHEEQFDKGVEQWSRYLRKKGIIAHQDDTGLMSTNTLLELAAAYAITKVLLPLRIGFSVWATPWFARTVLMPTMNVVKNFSRNKTR